MFILNLKMYEINKKNNDYKPLQCLIDVTLTSS